MIAKLYFTLSLFSGITAVMVLVISSVCIIVRSVKSHTYVDSEIMMILWRVVWFGILLFMISALFGWWSAIAEQSGL